MIKDTSQNISLLADLLETDQSTYIFNKVHSIQLSIATMADVSPQPETQKTEALIAMRNMLSNILQNIHAVKLQVYNCNKQLHPQGP